MTAAAMSTTGPSIQRLRQSVMVATGWTVLVVGALLSPLPGPFGFPVMMVGGIILLRNSATARKRFARAKRRAPGVLRPFVQQFDALRMRGRRKRRA